MTTTHRTERGIALLAVLFALVLLALLALPFAISMSVGAQAASREVHQTAVEQASASVRDLLLADAALSDPVFDPSPGYDGREEWPDRVELPKAFAPLAEDGRVLLGGEVWDTQRFFALDGISPLVLANLLGTATRLRESLGPDATVVAVEDASALPPSGVVWIANERIAYGQRDDTNLLDVVRGVVRDGRGEVVVDRTLAEDTLVLDYRCVLAAAWPFLRDEGRSRRPFASVRELAEIARAGSGGFTADELDTFEANVTVDALAAHAPVWGRPERVFDELVAGKSESLRVRSAVHIGAGSTIRIRDLGTGAFEYALVMQTWTENSSPDLPFKVFRLDLLSPVAQDHAAVDTVVEPLIPAPVNINTAPLDVLTALFRELRTAPNVRVHDVQGNQRSEALAPVTAAMARDLAEQIAALRGDGGDAGPGAGPFTGWRDLVARVFEPRLAATDNSREKWRWLTVYRNLETGRDSALDMGTAPICFASGPWVGYRAAASRSRSTVATGVATRHERTGTAVAVPGHTLEQAWDTQWRLEEAFRLDRRAPFWTTSPTNLGALLPFDTGNDPAPRYFSHVVPVAFPDLGLGAPRYASDDPADASLLPAVATAIATPRPPAARAWGSETFATSEDPRGHDVTRQGPYTIRNTGPSAPGGGGGNAGGGTGSRHELAFPFADPSSFVDRFAVSFWVEAQRLEGTTLFDHGDGDPDRNRIALHGRDGNLVFEVLDEAGIDPNPGDSPAGVPRTAAEWTLPLGELQLPSDTPMHVALSAYSNRPGELSVAVDGFTRGKPKHVTRLSAPIPAFDPRLANNSDDPPGRRGSERYLAIGVESTDGFPPVGVLRIGTELFEYSGISGNVFECIWHDSVGGRGARQIGLEHRPSIPVGPDGKPTEDVAQLLANAASQGLNLDVFPSHPVGARVELYGYTALLSEDSPMMPGETTLGAGIGGWAVARAWISSNPRDITIELPNGSSFTIGQGLDETWTGDLELCDPVPTGRQDPQPGSAEIVDAFPTTGGYALLVQRWLRWERTLATVSPQTQTGGVELVRYASRQGNKLRGVQRAQSLPGQDGQIDAYQFDGTARRFITDFEDWPALPPAPEPLLDDIPTLITWVVPVSIPVAGAGMLWDPQQTGLTEWVQILPRGGDNADTEWVRYDVIAENAHLVRANRAAWESLRYELTRQTQQETIQLGPLGTTSAPQMDAASPWGTVRADAGYIGYVPKREADYPQIRAARERLQFRGDPFTRTSSHAHSNAVVMQCHRLQLPLGNYGALSGRVGRHDRVALVQGSTASGSSRPAVEWHTVNWSARNYFADNTSRSNLTERLGPWPFQLVAFKDGVQGRFMGPPSGTVVFEPRQYDRVVKFPSGELPAAWCERVHVGSAVGNQQPITGAVDEVEVVLHGLPDLLVQTAFTAAASTFEVEPELTVTAAGPYWTGGSVVAEWPATGGLARIDDEILAYQTRADGTFTIAANGRGLLNTEPSDHDRGARVQFLTHRPVAILTANVGSRDHAFPVADTGSLPRRAGTVLLGQELLHYCWVRAPDGAPVLEMPRWYPPGDDATSTQARGLFRGRFGTAPQSGQSGEALIGFPFRYWDRYVEQSDDPELGYAQLTTTSAPAFFRTLRWREETRDPRVDVICLVRADGRAPWTSAEGTTDFWRFEQPADSATAHRIATQASRLEIRFQTVYRPGVFDPVAFSAHGWKTSARVEDVRLEYDGQRFVVDERVTAR